MHAVDIASFKGSAGQIPILVRSLFVSGLPATYISRFQSSKQSLWLGLDEQQENEREVHVVVSTGSGTGLASKFWKDLVRPSLAQTGFLAKPYQVHETTSESSIAELVEATILPQASNGVAQSILLLSGDGGVVDVVNSLLSGQQTETYKKPIITLLPVGTGNALANSAVVGDDTTLGLRTMFVGDPKELPLFRATFSSGARLLVNEGQEERELHSVVDGRPVAHGAVVCSWGLHATLVADSDTTEYRKFGAERFKMAGEEALFPSDGSSPHAYKGTVSILRPGRDDWEPVQGKEHGYVLATLVSNLEASFTISPSSQPLDGKLRLVRFGHVSGEDAMEIMKQAYQGGKHVDNDNVNYDEIKGLKIQFNEDDGRWRRVCIDGKIVRVEKGGWVEVRTDVKGVVDLISRIS